MMDETETQTQVDGSSTAVNNPTANLQYQMVLYDSSAVNDTGEGEAPQAPASRSFPNRARRTAPSISAYSVQCSRCFKWRLMPTREKYQEIREHILERPFFCESGQEWRPNMSCEDPPDITQDNSRVWAIDRPNIAKPPPGWQRHLRFRNRGGTKFSEVFYVSPLGKRLRSKLEAQSHLAEHPELDEGGSTLSKLSFSVPKPLDEDYVRKRPHPPTPMAAHLGMPEPSSEVLDVQPISSVAAKHEFREFL